MLQLESSRSSRPKVFRKKSVLRNFAKFTGKHPCQSLFFNKLAGLKSPTLLRKRLWYRCFPVNSAKFLRTPFLTEHLPVAVSVAPCSVQCFILLIGAPWDLVVKSKLSPRCDSKALRQLNPIHKKGAGTIC